MYQEIADYPKIALDQINAKGFERKDQQEFYQRTMNSLAPVKVLLDKIYQVSSNVELPQQLNAECNGLLIEFIEYINKLEEDEPNRYTQDFFNRKTNLLNQINNYINASLEVNPNNKFLFICNCVATYKRENLEQSRHQYDALTNEFFRFYETSKLNFESVAKEFDEIRNRVTTTLKEIQDKSSNALISNYAEVFGLESDGNRSTARNWLITAITFSMLLFVILVFIFLKGWFNVSERIVEPGKVYYIYDLSKLFTKVLLLSIMIYIVTYSAKKYSIYKHLQTINRHRQNALNSYKLLTESIIGNDPATRNNLMLQVAKAIYEHTTTGFLSSRQEEITSAGITEITKVIGGSRNE